MPIVAESCRIKAAVVEQDEHETGVRRTLNFGHTAGHALEAVTKYRRFRHGEAVAYGMLVAAEIAVARGTMPAADREALAALIAKMGPLPAVADVPVDDILEAITHDKKIVAGQLHYVLPTRIGGVRSRRGRDEGRDRTRAARADRRPAGRERGDGGTDPQRATEARTTEP